LICGPLELQDTASADPSATFACYTSVSGPS
jgi:hypothetical protein